MSDRYVYLMRGLPSCGKSHTARKLAADTGAIFETDEYFYTQVGSDSKRYDYREELWGAARRWNFERFTKAVDAGVSPIVVDRGNSLSLESQKYARYAVDRGYKVELKEPESEWWQELRVLLKYKHLTKPALYKWADRLARMSRCTHRVPAKTIRRWIDQWKYGLTVEEVLNYQPSQQSKSEGDGALKQRPLIFAQADGGPRIPKEAYRPRPRLSTIAGERTRPGVPRTDTACFP